RRRRRGSWSRPRRYSAPGGPARPGRTGGWSHARVVKRRVEEVGGDDVEGREIDDVVGQGGHVGDGARTDASANIGELASLPLAQLGVVSEVLVPRREPTCRAVGAVSQRSGLRPQDVDGLARAELRVGA